MHDVVIIGAGPAGCTAAIELARRRRNVLLIEQHRFPREKVCGECLSSLGIDVLENLGIADRIRKLGPAILHRTILHSPDGSSCAVRLPRPMWGISRRKLDGELLDIAAGFGVEIGQPVRCEGVEPGQRPRVHLRNLPTNRLWEVDCRVVVLADGKGSWNNKRPAPTGDLGIKACFEDVEGPSDAVELFGVPGHYGGLAPIEEGRWNAAFSVPTTAAAEFRGDLSALMTYVVSKNPALHRRLGHARRGGDWLAAPLPRFGVQSIWPRNVIPIGNAAAALEPIGGEGMGLAMRSALFAAEWIDRHIAGEAISVQTLRRRLAAMWRRRRAACRLMGILISRPATAQLMVGAADGATGIGGMVLRAIGKGDARFAAVGR